MITTTIDGVKLNYVICTSKTGIFKGFYNDFEAIVSIFSDTESIDDLLFYFVTDDMHEYILSVFRDLKSPIIDTSLLTDDTIIDDTKYVLLPAEKVIEIESVKSSYINKIKRACNQFITNGATVTLSDGSEKIFSFKIEDQINLKEYVDNHKMDSVIYYHAYGETDEEYSYNDIVTIYKTLYNNKIYNLIYTQVLCNWIENVYTIDDYNNKVVIDYGFSNDTIIEEVDKRYDQQKLS